MSKSKIDEGLRGCLFLYTVDILCNVEWCIRYLSSSSSIILYSIASLVFYVKWSGASGSSHLLLLSYS